jgi:hypothetical protein
MASRSRAPPTAEETVPEQWWVPKKVGRRPHRDKKLSHSCAAEGTRPSWTRHEKCCKSKLDRMDDREETSGATKIQDWNKRSRPKRAAMPRKRSDIGQVLQEGSTVRGREAKSLTFNQDSEV